MGITNITEELDAQLIFERGFVTNEEAKAVTLSVFSSKVNLEDDEGQIEGIWLALITEEDRTLYEESSIGKKIRGVLLNDGLAWYPHKTWGRVIEGVTKGNSRPVFIAEDQVPAFKKTHDAYEEEYGHEDLDGEDLDEDPNSEDED